MTEHDGRSVWDSAYRHLPSRILRMMLSYPEVQSRPDRLEAIRHLLETPRYHKMRLRRDSYVQVPL